VQAGTTLNAPGISSSTISFIVGDARASAARSRETLVFALGFLPLQYLPSIRGLILAWTCLDRPRNTDYRKKNLSIGEATPQIEKRIFKGASKCQQVCTGSTPQIFPHGVETVRENVDRPELRKHT